MLGHVEDGFHCSLFGLFTLAAVLHETLLLQCVLCRVDTFVQIRMLDINWVIAWVYLAVAKVHRNLCENFRLRQHSLVVGAYFGRVDLAIFIKNLVNKRLLNTVEK